MKLYKIGIIGIWIILCWLVPVEAASFGINSSTKEVLPNGAFTISVGGDCIGRVDLSVSNGTLSTNSVWVEQGYASVTVTAGGSGKVVVTATPAIGFSDADANIYSPGARSVSVNITSHSNSNPNKPPTSIPKSENNNLSELIVDQGELSPNFNENITEYTLNLPANVQQLTIRATASDAKSLVNGIGEINVFAGNNDIAIVVTAENGASKTYMIKAYVDETPEVYLNYKDEKVGFIRNHREIPLPEGFTSSEHIIEGHTVLVFSKGSIDIIYGQNEKNERGFYLFDKNQNMLQSKFIPLKINQTNFFIMDTEIKKEELLLDQILINETQVSCYKFKNGPEHYCLLNVLKEDGKLVPYIYESTENTIQLYHDFTPYLSVQVEGKNQNTIIYILISFLILAVGTIILLVLKIKKGISNEKTV